MTARLKAANETLSKDIIYTYWNGFGQFGDKKICMKGSYTNVIYTGQKEFLSYNTAHASDLRSKHILLLTGMKEFKTIFKKYEGLSIWQPTATLLVITTIISKLQDAPALIKISNVQKIVKLLFRFVNTSLERFTVHWDYQSVTLIA